MQQLHDEQTQISVNDHKDKVGFLFHHFYNLIGSPSLTANGYDYTTLERANPVIFQNLNIGRAVNG
jgi:hypothetical protein